MFTKILTSGLFAGVAAGLLVGLLQLVFVQPVLLHAELYESGELVHFGATAVSAIQPFPGIDPLRDGLSVGFTIVVYSGYALILVAAMAVAAMRMETTITARSGILWGIAGFAVVQLAPGFTLAPEVPGVAAADVYERQIWWFLTVAAAAIAVWFIAFGKSWKSWGASVVLLLVPHLLGAPQPDVFTGPVPTEIGALFASRAFGIGFAAWVLLGLFAGYFWNRESEREAAA